MGATARALPEDVRPVLVAYRDLLDRRFGNRLVSVRLFGSRARGDCDPESDADVAVVIRDVTDREIAQAVDLAVEAWRCIGFDAPLISPLVWSERDEAEYRHAERRLALDIEQEGIPV